MASSENLRTLPKVSLGSRVCRHGNHGTLNFTLFFIVCQMTRVFLKEMERRRKGHIVNMSSMCAYFPIPGGILYTSSKYAIRGFSEALAEELRQEGLDELIHVSSVHPYFVATRADLMDMVKPKFVPKPMLLYYSTLFLSILFSLAPTFEFLWLNRIPALSPKRCANAIIDGVLCNQLHIIIPSGARFFADLIHLLPNKVQHLVRDYVCHEKELAAIARARSDAVFK